MLLPQKSDGKMEGIPEALPLLVLIAEIKLCSVIHPVARAGCIARILPFHMGPLDADLRIIPGQAALVAGMPEIRYLVAEFRRLGKYQKAVGKALGDIELLLVLLGQLHAVPLAVGGASLPEVHRHVKHSALDDPHQLALGIF